jgi:2-polyprenyl-3-methyl-5-hydroxy-6-metoxy-1,4-benzoquinol methylase
MENQRKDENKALKSGERQVRSSLNEIEANHLWRYREATNYIRHSDTVVDVGFGCGYGSNIMSKYAKTVIGVDDSKEAVEYANKYWKADNITFINKNAFDIKEKVDVGVAFEVIEHIKDYENFIKQFKNLCQKYIVISVPHVSVPLTKSSWHWRHFKKEEIIALFEDDNWKTVRIEEPMFGKGKAVFAVFERKS